MQIILVVKIAATISMECVRNLATRTSTVPDNQSVMAKCTTVSMWTRTCGFAQRQLRVLVDTSTLNTKVDEFWEKRSIASVELLKSTHGGVGCVGMVHIASAFVTMLDTIQTDTSV